MAEIIGLVFMHMLGDYYLQSNNIALAKSNIIGDNNKFVNLKYLTIHSLLYMIPFLLLLFVIEWYWCILILGVLLISHWIIDLFTCWFKKKTKKTFAFILDQVIHIVILLIISKFFYFDIEILNGYEKILYGITIVSFLIKPSIVIVNHMFCDLFENEQVNDNGKFDVGAIIGVFERIIVLILCTFNAITAIALIVTVKTWARSADIKKNENQFGNKYLIGTLVSISLALIASYIWYKLM